MKRTITIRIGSSTLGTIQIMLIILKLASVIDWSWCVVLVPLWIELGIFVLVALILIIAHLFSKK